MSTPTRAAIAAALNTTGVLTASEFRPDPAGEGNAWVKSAGWLNDGTLPNGTFLADWEIYVITPQDEQAAEVWWDAHGLDIVGALLPLMYVESAEPVVFESQSGDLFAWLITGRSE